jgi:hypothetical protein
MFLKSGKPVQPTSFSEDVPFRKEGLGGGIILVANGVTEKQIGMAGECRAEKVGVKK